MSDDASALQQSLRAFLQGETGITYESLVQFATPLLELYDVPPGQDFDRHAPDSLEPLLDALEAARLLWAYFRLEEDEQQAYRRTLRTLFVGEQPGASERVQFEMLMDMMASAWASIPPMRREAAERQSGTPLPPFAVLVEHVGAAAPDDEDFGATMSDSFADFARPLIEAVDPADPDRLEEAMDRAQAYWELAQLSGSAYDQRLRALTLRYARTGDEARAVRAEAERMTERYHELFRRS